MICSSVNRFFMSNLLHGWDWTLKLCATQIGGTSPLQRVRASRRLPRRWATDKLGHGMKLADRIARLEARRPPVRPDPFADGVLEKLTDSELGDLFRHNGVEEFEDLPIDLRARAMELLSTARQRSHPAPPRQMEPGFDVMADIREVYEASQARLAQTVGA